MKRYKPQENLQCQILDMESFDSCEYDPKELDLEKSPVRIDNATMRQGPLMVSRIKISATSDINEFNE